MQLPSLHQVHIRNIPVVVQLTRDNQSIRRIACLVLANMHHAFRTRSRETSDNLRHPRNKPPHETRTKSVFCIRRIIPFYVHLEGEPRILCTNVVLIRPAKTIIEPFTRSTGQFSM